MGRTLLESLGCTGNASHAIHGTLGLLVRSPGSASRHICPRAMSPGVATSGLSVCTHAHAAYWVCLSCDCHTDYVSRSVATSLYCVSSLTDSYHLLLLFLRFRVRLCLKIATTSFLVFLDHITMSTRFTHASHEGHEQEWLFEPASQQKCKDDTTNPLLGQSVLSVSVALSSSQEIGSEDCLQNDLFYAEWAQLINVSLPVETAYLYELLHITPVSQRNTSSKCWSMTFYRYDWDDQPTNSKKH